MDQGDRVGFLLGAGASFELGMPLTSHLTAQFKAFFAPARLCRMNDTWRRDRGGYDLAVIDGVSAALSRSDMHYEAILGFIQTEQRRLNQTNDVLQQWHGLYARMVEIVYHLLLRRQIGNRRYVDGASVPYEGLLHFVERSRPLTIFSLNHDVMIELIADRIGAELRDGFWPDAPLTILPATSHPGLSASVLTKADLKARKLNFFESNQHGINLLKVHGALDTFAYNDSADLCRLNPRAAGWAGRIEPLRQLNFDLEPQLDFDRGRVVNEIVYLDANRQIQLLRRSILAGAQKFEPRHSQTLPEEMLALFKERINRIRRLYVVGYSFGDPHVDRVLREWLERLSEREMVVVDPCRSHLPSHFAHLLQQVALDRRAAAESFGAHRTRPLSRRQRMAAWLRKRVRPTMKARAASRLGGAL
jgi:hypothetical protein